MKSLATHIGVFVLGCVVTSLWQTWSVEPCAKVTAIVDQRVESLRAFETKTIEEQDRYIASLREVVIMLQTHNKELADTRDAAVRKVQELQPVSAKLDKIGQEVESIKVLAAQRAPIVEAIKKEAKEAGPEAFTMAWWRGQAMRLAAGRW